MSTKLSVFNNGTGTNIRRNKVQPAILNDATFRKVFHEAVDPIDYAVNVETKMQALKSSYLFPDVTHRLTSNNPEERGKAVAKLIEKLSIRTSSNNCKYDTKEIVDNTVKLFQRLRRYGVKQDFDEEAKVLKLLELLSSYESGAIQMSMMTTFIKELYNILYNVQAEHQDQAANILYNVTNQHKEIVREFLRKNKPFTQLSKIFNRATGTLYYPKSLFLHLAALIEMFPLTAVKNGIFDICCERIEKRLPGYYKENMKCMTALLKSKRGMELFELSGCMKILLKLIADRPSDINMEYVLKCFSEALSSKQNQKECVYHLELPAMIKNIAKKTNNPTVRFICFEIITKLYLVNPFDVLIYRDCMGWLKTMKCNGPVMVYLRNEFIGYVEKRHKKQRLEEVF